jgi:transcriptional regulator with XRE-family HTH domain
MLGEALRLIRVFNDLKQNEMADRISVSKSYLSEIERGQKIPTIDVLDKYSREFSLPISSIMFFAEELPKAKVGGRVRAKVAKNIMGMLQFIERKSSEETSNHA